MRFPSLSQVAYAVWNSVPLGQRTVTTSPTTPGVALKQVQRGVLTIMSPDPGGTITLSPTVDPAKTELRLLGCVPTGTPGAVNAQIVLTNASTITATRLGTTGDLTIAWEISEYY